MPNELTLERVDSPGIQVYGEDEEDEEAADSDESKRKRRRCLTARLPHADPARRARRVARGGFTLIEVLLTTLLIMGMLMVASMTQDPDRRALLKRDTIHNIQENQLVGPAILDLIENDLRGLMTHDRSADGLFRVKSRVVLGQDADSLDFVTTTDSLVWTYENDRALRSDYNEVGYRLRASASSDDFLEMYRREDFGIDDEPYAGGAWMFLHDQIRNFSITVFSEDGEDAEPFEEWGTEASEAETQGVPAWIEILLTLELSPRLKAEQLPIALVDRGTVTYRRIIRLPQSLRVEIADVPRLAIPTLPLDAPEPTQGGGAGAGADGDQPGGDEFGGGTGPGTGTGDLGGAAGGRSGGFSGGGGAPKDG